MTKHFRPDMAVHERFRGRGSRRWTALHIRGGRRAMRLNAASAGVVLVAAAAVGLANVAGGDGLSAVHAAGEAPARTATIPFFGYCPYGGGANCVVDGDTFYFGRNKLGIAGIDAPETHPPRCAKEKRLGEAATHRLRDLLNAGPVTVASLARDEDVSGRKLRQVAVGGADVGAALIAEGLARSDAAGRHSWCD